MGYNASFVMTLMCSILGSTIGGVSTQINILILSRFILGLGIGGAVPLTAVMTSSAHTCSNKREVKDDKKAKRYTQMMTLVVFSSQVFPNL